MLALSDDEDDDAPRRDFSFVVPSSGQLSCGTVSYSSGALQDSHLSLFLSGTIITDITAVEVDVEERKERLSSSLDAAEVMWQSR